MHYLSDIFRLENELNLHLQGKSRDLITCSQKIKRFIEKLSYWSEQLGNIKLTVFDSFIKTNPTQLCISDCKKHLKELQKNF